MSGSCNERIQRREKALPASAKKLRDARKKGQVEHSHDFVSAAVGAVAAIAYIWSHSEHVVELWRETLALALKLSGDPFGKSRCPALCVLVRLLQQTLLPLLAESRSLLRSSPIW